MAHPEVFACHKVLPVLVGGVTGSDADTLNGSYKPTGENFNGSEALRKVFNIGLLHTLRWLFHPIISTAQVGEPDKYMLRGTDGR